MNRRRSHNKGKKLSDRQDQKFAFSNESEHPKKLDSISIINRHLTDNIGDDRFILPRKNIRSRPKARWFNFNRGLFWGGIIGSNVIFSASCGVALTKIDVVEKTIIQTIDRIFPASKKFVTPKNTAFPIDKLLGGNDNVQARNLSSLQSSNRHNMDRSIDILLLETEPRDKKQIQSFLEFAARSKTILLLQFDTRLNTATVINIPVDSQVKIPGLGWGTLDDAYKYGGILLLSQSISQLLNDITIDRYVIATSASSNRLISSGKITFNDCDDRFEDCSNIAKQISRQEIAVETIRQRLNVPAYFKSFENLLVKTQSSLDTNLSLKEAMTIANFIKELESDDVEVNLVSGYIKGRSIDRDRTLNKSNFTTEDRTLLKSEFKSLPIVVRNTTDSPELGMQFVSYLRRLNFQNVYLVKHMPLKLNKTKIVIDRSQLARAKQLKSIVGFGKLESKSHSKQKPLTIQIGEDIRHFPLESSHDRFLR